MSLDLIFTGPVSKQVECICPNCGNSHQTEETDYESFNITHNLTKMADAVGLYGPLWQPSTEGITTARDLINPITSGLVLLRSDPKRFIPLGASNGWGTYDQFIKFLETVLQFVTDNPEMLVRASR